MITDIGKSGSSPSISRDLENVGKSGKMMVSGSQKMVNDLADVKAKPKALDDVNYQGGLDSQGKNIIKSGSKGVSDLDIPTTKPSINQGKDLFRNANFKKPDIKMVNDAANQVGIDRKEFGNYIHKLKGELGMRGDQNFTYQQLLEGHCCPCWIVLHNFQGKTKIAATTCEIVTADAIKHQKTCH